MFSAFRVIVASQDIPLDSYHQTSVKNIYKEAWDLSSVINQLLFIHKENLHRLMDAGENIVTEDKGKIETLNVFFTSVFNSHNSCAPGTQHPAPENSDGEKNEGQII